MLNLFLYAALGGALDFAGASAFDKPWAFFLILSIVIAIEFNAKQGN